MPKRGPKPKANPKLYATLARGPRLTRSAWEALDRLSSIFPGSTGARVSMLAETLGRIAEVSPSRRALYMRAPLDAQGRRKNTRRSPRHRMLVIPDADARENHPLYFVLAVARATTREGKDGKDGVVEISIVRHRKRCETHFDRVEVYQRTPTGVYQIVRGEGPEQE